MFFNGIILVRDELYFLFHVWKYIKILIYGPKYFINGTNYQVKPN